MTLHRILRLQSRVCRGGPGLHSILLAQGLSADAGSSYDTLLASGGLEPGEESLDHVAHSRGVQVRTIASMRRTINPWMDTRALVDVGRLIREYRPTLVHTHTAKAGAVGRLAASLHRVPVVVHTFHGHVLSGYFGAARSKIYTKVERHLGAISDCIITVSESLRRQLVDRFRIAAESKVRVIPLGFDVDPYLHLPEAGRFRGSLGLDLEAPLAVAVGRIVPIKRFDRLIRAFAGVRAAVPGAHLVIVGGGEASEMRALERVARSVDVPLHLPGFRTDIPAVLRDADVFCVSSDNEGTPLAMIEALVAGVPVVATDVGGVRDVLQEGYGRLLPVAATRDYARALVEALQTKLRLPLAERLAVAARFSHHRLRADVERLYDELIERKAASSVLPRRL